MSITSPLRRVVIPTRTLLNRPSAFSPPTLSSPKTNMSTAPTYDKPTRQPSTEEKELIDDVLQLYQLNPISAAYARYSPDATFHDPIGLAKGLEAVKAQFNSMPSLFSKSVTKDLKVLDNPDVKPPSVQFSLAQLYTFKTPNTDKLVNSLVTLHVDPITKLITEHSEEWDGKPNTTGDDGFFGKINEFRKSLTAEAVKAGVDTRPVDQR